MTTITIKLSDNRTSMHIQTDRPSREANAELRKAIETLELEIEEMPASHFGCPECGYSTGYHSHRCNQHPRYQI